MNKLQGKRLKWWGPKYFHLSSSVKFHYDICSFYRFLSLPYTMSILKLPPELLMSIAKASECRDLNALLQCHSYLYNTLNEYLYQRNVQQHGTSAMYWAASSGSHGTLQHLLDVGANVQWESEYLACSVQKPGTRLRFPIQLEDMKEHQSPTQQLKDASRSWSISLI